MKKRNGTWSSMTVRFDENSQAVKAITTFQSVAESYIRKGHYTCPSRMTRVISWRTSSSGRASYAFSIRRTRKASTVVTSTAPIFQNYQDAESWCAKTTLNGTKRIRSVQRGHSRGFVQTCATSPKVMMGEPSGRAYLWVINLYFKYNNG